MSNSIEEIEASLENLNIQEADQFESWNLLPPELKLKCIQEMTIIQKWNLRQTSHTEKDLVDSQKLEVKSFILHHYSLDVQTLSGSGNLNFQFPENRNDFTPLILFIIKKLVARTMEIGADFIFSSQLGENIPIERMFQVDAIFLSCHWIEDWLARLKKANSIFIAQFAGFIKQETVDFVVGDVVVNNAHFLQASLSVGLISLILIIQKWSKNPPAIDTEFQLKTYFPASSVYYSLMTMKGIKFIERGEVLEQVRFKTEDSRKDIFVFQEQRQTAVYCIVIPSDLEEFEMKYRWKSFQIV